MIANAHTDSAYMLMWLLLFPNPLQRGTIRGAKVNPLFTQVAVQIQTQQLIKNTLVKVDILTSSLK